MATSGSVNFNVTRSDVIQAAFRHCGALALGESLDANEEAAAIQSIQGITKAWQAEGVHLWKVEDCVLFLTVGTEKYSLGASGDRATLASDLVQTKLGGDEAAAQTVLTVDSSTGMAASDYVGIVLDSGSVDWTTIASVDSSTQITVASGLTGAAAEDNVIYTYTTLLDRPLRIMEARLRDWTPTLPVDQPFAPMMSRSDYMMLTNKKDEGDPIQGYYDPQLVKGDFFIWSAPNTSSKTVGFTAAMPIEDLDAASDTADFPQEWAMALEWNLARILAPDVGVDRDTMMMIVSLAGEFKYNLSGWDAEPVSYFFQPGFE